MHLEEKLTVLAAYHVGLFAGTASRLDGSKEVPAVIAHALFLLIEEAKRRREEWLGGTSQAP